MAAQHKTPEAHAVFFAAGKHIDFLADIVAREQHAAHDRTHGLVVVAGLAIVAQPIEQRFVRLELLGHILRHIAKIGAFGPFDGTGIGRKVARQHAQEGCLTYPVGTDNGDFLARFDHGRERLYDRLIVGFADGFDGDGQAMQHFGLFEPDIGILARRRLDLDGRRLDACRSA